MLLKVDTASSVPVYAQIVAQVKHAATTGVLRPGDALPSLRDTARTLRVNPNTVIKAYRELEVQGVVKTEHGRGTTVTMNGSDTAAEYRRDELDRLADQLLVGGYHLGATPDEIAQSLRRRLAAMHPDFEARDARLAANTDKEVLHDRT